MEMRIITLKNKDAFTQMAIDEVILDQVIESGSPETVRFYSFKPAAVTIGRLQSLDDIDVGFCTKNGIDVVRRLTGGRAVLHSRDFTFSFIINKNNPVFKGSIYDTYKSISAPFLSALLHLGFRARWEKFNHHRMGKNKNNLVHNPLCFASTTRYELTIEGRKILGIAQYRKKNAILVQGSLVLQDVDTELCNIVSGGIDVKDIFSSKGKMNISFDEFGELLKGEIARTNHIDLNDSKLYEEEMKKVDEKRKKYCSSKWNNLN